MEEENNLDDKIKPEEVEFGSPLDLLHAFRKWAKEGLTIIDLADMVIGLNEEWANFYKQLSDFIPIDKIGESRENNHDPLDWKTSAHAMSLLQVLNSSGLAYQAYIKGIRNLEKIIGKITFVPSFNDITDETHKDNYLTYFFNRATDSELSSGLRNSMSETLLEKLGELREKVLINPEMDNVDKFINLIISGYLKQLEAFAKQTPKAILDRYILSWDFIYRNFVEPIFIAMKKSKTIPESINEEWQEKFNKNKKNIPLKWRKYPRYLEIKAIKEIFNQYDFCEPMRIWLEGLDVDLRNSLIHEKYYIKDDIVHYYFINRGKSVFQEKSIQDIVVLNQKQFLNIILIPRIIGMLLAEELRNSRSPGKTAGV